MVPRLPAMSTLTSARFCRADIRDVSLSCCASGYWVWCCPAQAAGQVERSVSDGWSGCRSVGVGQRALDVDRGQQGEHIGLQGTDQQLEEHQADAGRERQHEQGVPGTAGLEQVE